MFSLHYKNGLETIVAGFQDWRFLLHTHKQKKPTIESAFHILENGCGT